MWKSGRLVQARETEGEEQGRPLAYGLSLTACGRERHVIVTIS
jgi:hypothetical protein